MKKARKYGILRVSIHLVSPIWCGKRDLNPYVKDTRTSNVRVCQFRHPRIPYCFRSPEISEVKDRDADCLNILPRSRQIVKRFFSF